MDSKLNRDPTAKTNRLRGGRLVWRVSSNAGVVTFHHFFQSSGVVLSSLSFGSLASLHARLLLFLARLIPHSRFRKCFHIFMISMCQSVC